MGATSIQVEPVQSSTTQNGWGFINLQNTEHENRGEKKKKIKKNHSNPGTSKLSLKLPLLTTVCNAA